MKQKLNFIVHKMWISLRSTASQHFSFIWICNETQGIITLAVCIAFSFAPVGVFLQRNTSEYILHEARRRTVVSPRCGWAYRFAVSICIDLLMVYLMTLSVARVKQPGPAVWSQCFYRPHCSVSCLYFQNVLFMLVFWVLTPCGVVVTRQRFGVT
jgi:hypothetical protein